MDFVFSWRIICLDNVFVVTLWPDSYEDNMYYERSIDKYLQDWSHKSEHKPILLRGARQVGKSSAVRHLAESFPSFVEINFEKRPDYKAIFQQDLDVHRIVSQLAVLAGTSISPGQTLLFLDEIQTCPEAIMALRFFKEDLPQMHVIAAGSLLEFALTDLPTFGVGRIHSVFMYPMTFDEFLLALGERLLLQARNEASVTQPLAEPLHAKLVEQLRAYMLVGGMPEVVTRWVQTHDFIQCQALQDELIMSYEDDFPKYNKRVDVNLLRKTWRSAAVQATKKFAFAQVGEYKAKDVRSALDLLVLAGLLIPITHTSADGLPLGSGENPSYRKYIVFDSGIMLRLLNLYMGNVQEITMQILTSSAADLVNKGTIAEQLAGLELLHYLPPNKRYDMYYWVRTEKNATAEIDYLADYAQAILPIEVKAGVQGGMKSLWAYMHDKHLKNAVRISLENFSCFDYQDTTAGATRHVTICPLYAVAMLHKLLQQEG